MIDVHPPHEPANTWRQFFIHIATIVVGLLIAIGLEQMVEAIHHHHQRVELVEQMRDEAQKSLPLLRESIARLNQQRAYLVALNQALNAGKVSGDSIDVAGVPPYGGSTLYVSPSRATWSSALSAGLVDVLPSERAQLYARLDFSAQEALSAEDDMYDKLRAFVAACKSAHYEHASPATSHLSLAQRDTLLLRSNELKQALYNFTVRSAIMLGADEAIVANAHSLEDMYPYQNAALARIPPDRDMSNFYGGSTTFQYKEAPEPLSKTER